MTPSFLRGRAFTVTLLFSLLLFALGKYAACCEGCGLELRASFETRFR
jgi:hypothetical protein